MCARVCVRARVCACLWVCVHNSKPGDYAAMQKYVFESNVPADTGHQIVC